MLNAKSWVIEPAEEGSAEDLKIEDQPVVIGPPTRFSSRISRKLMIRKLHSISERRAWSNMTLTVISGICRVEMECGDVLVKDSESIEIQSHVEHCLFAVTAVRAIVSFDANSSIQ